MCTCNININYVNMNVLVQVMCLLLGVCYIISGSGHDNEGVTSVNCSMAGSESK